MKTLLAFILCLVGFGAVAAAPEIQRNRYTTNNDAVAFAADTNNINLQITRAGIQAPTNFTGMSSNIVPVANYPSGQHNLTILINTNCVYYYSPGANEVLVTNTSGGLAGGFLLTTNGFFTNYTSTSLKLRGRATGVPTTAIITNVIGVGPGNAYLAKHSGGQDAENVSLLRATVGGTQANSEASALPAVANTTTFPPPDFVGQVAVTLGGQLWYMTSAGWSAAWSFGDSISAYSSNSFHLFAVSNGVDNVITLRNDDQVHYSAICWKESLIIGSREMGAIGYGNSGAPGYTGLNFMEQEQSVPFLFTVGGNVNFGAAGTPIGGTADTLGDTVWYDNATTVPVPSKVNTRHKISDGTWLFNKHVTADSLSLTNGLDVRGSITNANGVMAAGLPVVTDTSTNFITRLLTPGDLTVATQAPKSTGTAYTFTATPASIAFGSTTATLTLNTAGTYMIMGFVSVKYNAATFAANRTVNVHLRRTNNTPLDIAGSDRTVTLRVVTTVTDSAGVLPIPGTIYTATAGDTLQLFGSVSVVPTAGSLDADSADIIAVRVN